jgi:hypothetical protein
LTPPVYSIFLPLVGPILVLRQPSWPSLPARFKRLQFLSALYFVAITFLLTIGASLLSLSLTS